MLITSGTKGQFGNAYLSSAYHLAHALEHGYRLRLYNLGPYRDHLVGADGFPRILIGGNTGNLAGIAVGRAYRFITRRKITRLGPLAILNDQGGTYPLTPAELATVASSGITISGGWKFRDRPTLQKQIVTIRSILAFRSQYLDAARAKIREIRGNACHIIAIHIRMGDYRDFMGGQYFFSPEDYQRIATQAVENSGHDPSDVVVMPFSNEKLDWPATLAGARVLTAGGSWWEDFLCLSLSDLIIGPPSTFSGSASLLGDVPWFQIKDKDAPFDLRTAKTYLESGIRS
jgi:hypothetical protein